MTARSASATSHASRRRLDVQTPIVFACSYCARRTILYLRSAGWAAFGHIVLARQGIRCGECSATIETNPEMAVEM